MTDYLFSGLKVLDVASVIAAPAAAMMLADFGADVIKIEQPGDGDMLRMLSHIPTTPEAGNDWFWQLDGRNKRGLALDLKSAAGREILLKLVAECDVFITNQPAEVRAALQLRYADLAPHNPAMIYASLTAYGETGPEAARKGFDQLAYWARSGLMDLMREPGTRPAQGLPGMGDHPTGVALYAAIVTALLQRERTGAGAEVTTSLLANGLWSAAGIAQGVMAGGDMPAYRRNNVVPSAMMRPYRASDNRWLQFNMVRNEELLALLLTAMEALHLLADPRFDAAEKLWENRAALGDELQAIIGRTASGEWLARFEELGVPVNRVAIVEETANDPQILANGLAVAPLEDNGVPLIINHPLRISSVAQVGPKRAPRLGEHAKQILRELGYSDADIRTLHDAGVFQVAPPPA